jgi:hypothetical protein
LIPIVLLAHLLFNKVQGGGVGFFEGIDYHARVALALGLGEQFIDLSIAIPSRPDLVAVP